MLKRIIIIQMLFFLPYLGNKTSASPLLLNSDIGIPGYEIKHFEGDAMNDDYVYWFFVRARIDRRKKQYKLVGTGSRIQSGKIQKFDKKLWWGTTKGQLAIGPFLSYEEARSSRVLYRKNKNKISEFSEEEQKRKVNWFLVSFTVRKRSRSYQMKRMPARVAEGTNLEFVDALFEGLTFQHMVVGPFWNYYQAEKAKEMYRRNE